jgi:hypothetical protein
VHGDLLGRTCPRPKLLGHVREANDTVLCLRGIPHILPFFTAEWTGILYLVTLLLYEIITNQTVSVQFKNLLNNLSNWLGINALG